MKEFFYKLYFKKYILNTEFFSTANEYNWIKQKPNEYLLDSYMADIDGEAIIMSFHGPNMLGDCVLIIGTNLSPARRSLHGNFKIKVLKWYLRDKFFDSKDQIISRNRNKKLLKM